MNTTAPDLRSLSSARSSANLPPTTSSTTVSTVPRPAARWRTRVLVPLAVILATGGVLGYSARDAFKARAGVWVAPALPAPDPRPAAEGSTEAPATDDAPEAAEGATAAPGAVLVQAPGWIEPSPYAVSVAALTDGVIREMLVLEGEVVAAGQVVARLVDDDAKLHARATRASLSERQADVERAASAVASAEAQVRVEQANAAELRDEIARKRSLAESGAVGAGEFRRLEIRLSGLDAKIGAAERLVDETRAMLRQAEAAVASAQVTVEEADLRVARTEIRAPVDGVVMTRLVDPGSRITMTSASGEGAMPGAVLRLYDPAHLQVRVDVPLADAGKVGVGTPCSITSEVLADTTFHGRVTRIVHEANIQRNTVQYKVIIDDPSPVLKPEMLTRVKLHAQGTSRKAAAGSAAAGLPGTGGDASLLVPASAVSSSASGSASVWVVDVASGSSIARRREVRASPASDPGYSLVQSGLRLTDRVILEPPASLTDGSSVRVLGERSVSQGANP